MKKLTNQSKNSSAPQNAIINDVKLSSAEFSEQINDFYINVGGNALPPSVDVRPDPNNKLDPLSIGETKFLLKKLDTSKATNNEDFPTWISKMGCEDICLPLQNILNSVLSTCELLSYCKVGVED